MKHSAKPIPKFEPSDVHPHAAAVTPLRDRLFLKLSLLFTSAVLTLIAIEIAVRLLSPALAPVEWKDRPKMWYLPERSRDQRNDLFTAKKDPNTFRIIAVGDSFSFAGKVQYDDGYSKRLERILNQNVHQKKVEVLNWGVPGFSTLDETKLVYKAVTEYSADAVVLQITLNDPEQEPYHVSHAYLYEWDKTVERGAIFHYWKTLGLVARRLLNALHTHDYVTYHQSLFEDETNWKPFSTALEKIHKASLESHVPVVALIFPMLSHPFDSRYPFRPAHVKIAARLDELGIPFVDLLPAMQGIPPERLQAMPGKDAHPNEIAHRIASEELFGLLEAKGILPSDVIPKNVRQKGRRLGKSIATGRSVGGVEQDDS